MSIIWKAIDNNNLKTKAKTRLFVACITLICVLIGGGIWLVGARFFLPELRWLICFIGYVAIFPGLMGSALYLFNHEFSESGSECKNTERP